MACVASILWRRIDMLSSYTDKSIVFCADKAPASLAKATKVRKNIPSGALTPRRFSLAKEKKRARRTGPRDDQAQSPPAA